MDLCSVNVCVCVCGCVGGLGGITYLTISSFHLSHCSTCFNEQTALACQNNVKREVKQETNFLRSIEVKKRAPFDLICGNSCVFCLLYVHIIVSVVFPNPPDLWNTRFSFIYECPEWLLTFQQVPQSTVRVPPDKQRHTGLFHALCSVERCWESPGSRTDIMTPKDCALHEYGLCSLSFVFLHIYLPFYRSVCPSLSL